MSDAEQSLRRYFAALADMKTGDELATFFHPEIEQTEFPNALNPKGAVRDLTAILEGAERGKLVTVAQTYEVENLVLDGQRAIAEVIWTGTLAMDVASLQKGDVMRARFACAFELRDGVIYRQRNYDCFDPF